MATHIATTLNAIDSMVLTYAQTVFTSFSGPITTTIRAGGLVALCFVAANALLQWMPIRMSSYLLWGLRYVIILAVASTWAQFQPFYDMLTNVPSAVGATLLSITGANSLNGALDQMVTNLFTLADTVSAQSGRWDFGMALTAILLMVVGAAMACVAILVSAIAKIGIAMAVSLAPIFIATLLFRGTSDLFTSWSRWTLGFALIPVVLAGVMGAVIGVGRQIMVQPSSVSALSDVAAFLIVVLAAIIMMAQVPTMVSGLAGSIVATASTSAIARSANSILSGTGARIVRGGVPRMAQAGSAIGAARAADPGARMKAALDDYKTTRAAGQQSKENLRDRAARFGKQTTFGQRVEADRAGRHEAARRQAKDRARTRRPDETKT